MKKERRPVFLFLLILATMCIVGYLTWDDLVAGLNNATSAPAALANFATMVLFVFMFGMTLMVMIWNFALNIATEIREDVREEAKKLAAAEQAKTNCAA